MSIADVLPEEMTVSTASSSSWSSGRRSVTGFVLVSAVASITPGTTAGVVLDPSALLPATSKTDAGQTEADGAEHAAAIAGLRHLTGLTWDQIATLFEVSRRAVHFWASGRPMAAAHHEHLQRSLGCLRAVDRGNAPANRQDLFAPNASGVAPFDLLVRRQYAEFIVMMGRPPVGLRTAAPPARVSHDRLPRPPKVLVSAREEPAHHEAGSPRRALVVRSERAQ